MLVTIPEPLPEGEGVPTLEERSERAGTELEMGCAIVLSRELETEEARALGWDFPSGTRFAWSGGGRSPPDRNEGHKERSSGSDVPPDAEGARCERMAAACRAGHGKLDVMKEGTS